MSGNKIGGLILIVVGAAFLAHNFGLLSFHAIWRWWPAVLIVLGIAILFSRR